MARFSVQQFWNALMTRITVVTRRLRQWIADVRGVPLFLGVEHVGIYPTQNASGQMIAQWYKDRFGFELKEGVTNYFVGCIGHGRIEIMKEAITDRCHIAIQVSDFEKATANLKARGVPLEEPLPTKPGIKAVFLKEPDPAGNRVHLYWIGQRPH